MKTKKMQVYKCSDCEVVTEKTKCLLCGKATKPVDTKKIRRFPREFSKEELASRKLIEQIEQKCLEFECPGKVIKVRTGPIVSQFDFQLSKFIRVKRLRGMSEDLALGLGVDQVAIIRIPGEKAVSIMVPNETRKPIQFEDTLKATMAMRKTMALPLNLGVDSLGGPVVVDLAKLPHLLVAGTTGSGKSVFLNCLITSLLYGKSPKEMEMVLIDPKQVELTQYRELPHVKRDVVSNIYDALRTLEECIQEMTKRMTYIAYKKCKNLAELNEKLDPKDRLPYIVVVIDEIAELMLQERKSFTEKLARISSLARAAGMHVIAATQRPSNDVVSGKIKVNFPARICFKVPSSVDSKVVLTTKGAEQLNQCGDAFALLPEKAGLTRVHIPMVDEKDVKKLIRASLAAGHHLRVPAELTPEEIKAMEAELLQSEAAQDKADHSSAADLFEDNANQKKGRVM